LFCERLAKISFSALREPDIKVCDDLLAYCCFFLLLKCDFCFIQAQCDIPLYVMVLKNEEAEIRRLLELNDYFGLKPENIRFLHQPTLPCYDGARQIAFACSDPPRLASAPNGDGGVIGALSKVCSPLLDFLGSCHVLSFEMFYLTRALFFYYY
jgi:hypothetical protein